MSISTINFGQRKIYKPRGHQVAYPKKEYDGLDIYRQSIARYPRITRDEELDLFEKLKIGGKDAETAREKLILSNLRIPYDLAKRYSFERLPMEDLIQIGNMGLMDAVTEKYDKNYAFSTYAYYKVQGRLTYEIEKNCRVVKMPRGSSSIKNKIKDFINAFEMNQLRKPSITEIVDGTGISERRVSNFFNSLKVELSLNERFQKKEKAIEYMEMLADENTPNPFEVQEMKEIKEDIIKALKYSTLMPNEKTVIRLYFGLSDEEPQSSIEIGKKLKISPQRVNQLKASALQKLRKNKFIKYHKDFFS